MTLHIKKIYNFNINNMCKKDCDNEDEFHCLQKKITKLEIVQAKLVLKNKKNKCNQKICSICSCSNGNYEFFTDTNEKKYLCKYCINKIKKTNNPEQLINNDYCPVCNGDDGCYVINYITTSLCKDCFRGIKNKF